MKKFSILFLHILVWGVIFFVMPFRSQSINDINPLDISYIVILIFSFYFNYFFVLPRIVKNPKASSIIFYLLLFFSANILLKFIFENILIIKILGFKTGENSPNSISYLIISNAIQATMPLLFSSFIWFIIYTFKVEKERQLLLKQKKEAELVF